MNKYLLSLGYNLDAFEIPGSLYRKIEKISKEFPLGSPIVFLSTDMDHVIKTGLLLEFLYEKNPSTILFANAFDIDSLNFTDLSSISGRYLISVVEHFSKEYLDTSIFLKFLNFSIRNSIPMLISTPYTLKEFSDKLPKTITSAILPYLKGYI